MCFLSPKGVERSNRKGVKLWLYLSEFLTSGLPGSGFTVLFTYDLERMGKNIFKGGCHRIRN